MTENEDDFQAAFGRAVRSLRQDLRMTQEMFGARAGLHRNYVGAIERGELNPTLKIICKCARGGGVKLSMLFHIAQEIQETGRVPQRQVPVPRVSRRKSLAS